MLNSFGNYVLSGLMSKYAGLTKGITSLIIELRDIY